MAQNQWGSVPPGGAVGPSGLAARPATCSCPNPLIDRVHPSDKVCPGLPELHDSVCTTAKWTLSQASANPENRRWLCQQVIAIKLWPQRHQLRPTECLLCCKQTCLKNDFSKQNAHQYLLGIRAPRCAHSRLLLPPLTWRARLP